MALDYLQSIGLNPAQAVRLIVATHWHDDHIRGMANMVEQCDKAAFCCSSVLTREELLAAIHALEERHMTVAGSGVQEIHRVISRLSRVASSPRWALRNRHVYSHDGCEIWSLSPDDTAVGSFLRGIGTLFPSQGEGKTRALDLSPNEVAVVLWVGIGDIRVVLGSDLDRRGWVAILKNEEGPTGSASAFKIPHHGSESSYEPEVWEQMLDPDAFAVLAPWRKGSRVLPGPRDVQRILSHSSNAYATARGALAAPTRGRGHRMVDRTIRESGVRLRRLRRSFNAVRLRRPIGSRGRWQVEKFGSACHLRDY